MFDQTLIEVLTAQILFWVLLPVVLFAAPKWSVLAWLVMGNLDGTGPSSTASATQIGAINATKGVLLPLYLYWRFRHKRGTVQSAAAAKIWVALTAYAAIATIWSPFPLAATKLVANMVGIYVSVLLIEKAARLGLLDSTVLVLFCGATLALGVVQTYYFGGSAYGFDGVDQPPRFSSFVAAQQYAALLVALLTAVLFWRPPMQALLKPLLLGSLGIALVLNGSRTWFLGAAAAFLIYLAVSVRREVVVTCSAMLFGLLLSTSLADALNPQGSIIENTQSRILATARAVLGGEDNTEQAGLRTFTFRLGMYEGVVDELAASSPWQLIAGHGTSSGAIAALSRFPARYSPEKIDPNRIIHNEWLRALFEWGAGGLILFLAVFAAMIVAFLRAHGRRMVLLSVSAYMPALLTALATENILAGAGNAVTISFVFLVSTVWVCPPHCIRETAPSSVRRQAAQGA